LKSEEGVIPKKAAEDGSEKAAKKSADGQGKKKKKEKGESKKKATGDGEDNTSKKKEKKTASSSTSKKTKLKSNTSIDLLISNEPVNRSENDYNELLSPEHEIKSITPVKDETENNAKSSTKQVDDDMDFWLATSDPAPQANGVAEAAKEETFVPKEKKKEKKTKSKSKSKDESGEKKSKKSSKSKKQAQENDNNDNTLVDDHVSISEENNVEFDLYKPLASNKHLKIVIYQILYLILGFYRILISIRFKTYLVVPNQMNLNQIVIGMKMRNVAEDNKLINAQIHSIELNLLDTNNLSLIRNQVCFSI
jgi:hypothetical protein